MASLNVLNKRSEAVCCAPGIPRGSEMKNKQGSFSWFFQEKFPTHMSH